MAKNYAILLLRGGSVGAKDLTAKKLEDYNDVFADIYNTLLFGENLINEQQLDFGLTERIKNQPRSSDELRG